MLGNAHFYHQTVKKTISIFGTLFNDLYVITTDNSGKEIKRIQVPLAYGPKHKFLARIDQEPELDGYSGVAIKLPRMSFELTSLSYDTNPKLNKHNQVVYANPNGTANTKKVAYTYSPYIASMQLSIMVKNQSDGLQILEQIIPYFQPDYTVAYKPLSDTDSDIRDDVPIVLNGVATDEDYTGDFLTRRAIIYTLDFSMKIRFYGPITERGIIREVYPSFFVDDNADPTLEYKHTTNPTTAAETDTWSFTTERL